MGWLLFEKLVKAFVGVSVTVWIARYLGPADFGLLSYALAVVGILGAIAALGLETITIRELVRNPAENARLLGTAFVLRLGAGVFAFVISVPVAFLLRPEDSAAITITAIIGFSLVLGASEIVRYWFDSQVESRYCVWVITIAIILSSAGRIALILGRAPLIYFAWMVLIEAALIAGGFMLVYRFRAGPLSRWRFGFTEAKSLCASAWPLLLSGLAVMLYMRIDQLMLASMAGVSVVGQYAASAKISEVWNMIPMVMLVTLFPAIVRASEAESDSLEPKMERLMSPLVLSALAISLVVTAFSGPITAGLFGESYTAAGEILRVHVWSCVFVFIGVAGNRWYVAKDLQRHALYFTAAGAGVNIALNLWLIPLQGATGAAIATVVSYAISGYVLDAFSAKTRPIFVAKTRAMLLIPLLMPRLR
jgi:O-antigen/teichoic acid export membrane protein